MTLSEQEAKELVHQVLRSFRFDGTRYVKGQISTDEHDELLDWINEGKIAVTEVGAEVED